MGGRIKGFLVAAFIAFAVSAVTASRPSYSDSVTVPQVNSNLNKESNKSVQDYYLQGINYYRCDVANIKDLITTADVPETLGSMLKDFKSQYDELPQWQSIYHNFRDGVLNEHSTPEERRNAVVCATVEYFNSILNPMARLTWKYLDPSFPNVKFVSKDKHKEVVYNKRTGQKVDSGINQGTANAAASLFNPEHHEDIKRFERCGTPSEAERHLANFLLQNQCVSADYIKTLLDEIDARAKKRTAEFFNPNDKAQHPALDDHSRGDHSGKVAVKDEPLDSCKTTDVAVVERKKDTSQVGVRGWCTCGAEHGKIYQCGVGAFIPGLNLGDYVYELCARCGKILKPNKTDKEAKIFDMRIDRKYRGDSGLIGGIPLHKYEALLKQTENKLLDIPDGEIVIRGTCVCKEPDPIHVGFLDWGYSPYVCILCGRVRLPDKDGSIPNGQTALSEMGLDKQAESARERMLEWIEHNR